MDQSEYEAVTFAVKIVRADDQEKIEAHIREFDILKSLDHKNLVRGIQVFRNDFKNEVFQVMEYIEGEDILEDVACAQHFDEEMAKGLFKQVLEGLVYLHRNNVCHRDIKPSNIMITKDRKRIVIADFNVAKKKAESDKGPFEMFTKTAGSLAFASPERLLETQPYTVKVDIWAAGIVLVMLLTGTYPFESSGMTSKLFEDIQNGQSIIDDMMFFNNTLSENVK